MPFTPGSDAKPIPNGAGGVESGMGNISEPIMTRQGAVTALTSVAQTLTPAQLFTGVITSFNAGASTFTLPLATDLDLALPNAAMDSAFEVSLVNTGAAATASFATNTGWTAIGFLTVPVNSAYKYRLRKVAAGNWQIILLG